MSTSEYVVTVAAAAVFFGPAMLMAAVLGWPFYTGRRRSE